MTRHSGDVVPVPFNRPSITEIELDAVRQSLEGRYLSGDGTSTKRARARLEELHPGATVMLTTSGTAALEMAALLLELEPGDEVIVPSFTFSSTATAFALAGAQLVFADSSPGTWCLDPASVRAALSPRTRAIVTVHYGGVPGNLAELAALADDANVDLVEDNAHGLFGAVGDVPLGTTGRFGILSFHETKNVTSGEGGALIVNRPADVVRAEIIREKGTNRSAFFRGAIDKYTWVDIGSSYVMADLNASLLDAQLQRSAEIQARRLAAVSAYDDSLGGWAARNGFELQAQVPGAREVAHLFALLAPSLRVRDAFMGHMRERGVAAVFHYQPLHSSPAGRRFASAQSECALATDLGDRLVRLPVFSDITADEVGAVIRAAGEFRA